MSFGKFRAAFPSLCKAELVVGRSLTSIVRNHCVWTLSSTRITALSASLGGEYRKIQTRCSSEYSAKRVGLVTPLFLQGNKYGDDLAVVDQYGHHRYSDIIRYANFLTDTITDELEAKNDDTNGERISFLCSNDVSYSVVQWATWMSGSVAVALSDKHPEAQLCYFVQDSQSKILIANDTLVDRVSGLVKQLGVKIITFDTSIFFRRQDLVITEEHLAEGSRQERWNKRRNRLQQLRDRNKFKDRPAIIVYTSGTTGNPKACFTDNSTN